MVRTGLLIVALVLGLGGCLEDDPDYIPPDSSAGTDASGTADSTGTTTATDTSATTTGVTCDPPLEQCADQCIDTMIDKNNCGQCFNKCTPPSQFNCVDGMCVPK